MSPRELPARPNLEHLKNQARTLLRRALASNPEAIAQFFPIGVMGTPKLADALHIIARDYGFETWPKLKLHIEAQSEDAGEALAAAIRSKDAKVLRAVLTRHPSLRDRINEPVPNLDFEAPAIVAAANRESRESVEALLAAGADINARSKWWAGSYGVLDSCTRTFAEFLISRGAKLDICAASRLGMIQEVKQMLVADPQLVQARGGDGQLPLHFAATCDVAELLLEHGAEIDARDIDHESTAAQYMACFGREPHSPKSDRHDIVRLLLSRGAQPDILMASAIGDLALVEKILNDDPETVRVTVNDRYFPKRDPRSGGTIYMFGFGITKTPHIIAREFGHQKVFELLMQRSAPWLRLSQTAETGDEAQVREVLKKHPEVIRKLSPTAARRLVGVAVRNNTRAIELLLESGWPPNATLENQQTALHYAAWHGNLAMVRTLLSRGAAVNVVENQFGGTPLGWTLHGSLNSWEREKGDYPAVARALLAAGAVLPEHERGWEGAEEVLIAIRENTPNH